MIPPFGLNRGLLQDEKIDNLIKESYDKKNWDSALEYIHQRVLIYPLWYEGNFMASLDTICDFRSFSAFLARFWIFPGKDLSFLASAIHLLSDSSGSCRGSIL